MIATAVVTGPEKLSVTSISARLPVFRESNLIGSVGGKKRVITFELKDLASEFLQVWASTEYRPTVENVGIMFSLLEGEECHAEMARDLADAIAQDWESGWVSPTSETFRVITDWMATAEEYADPEGLAEMRAARESLERGEGTPLEEVAKRLDL